MNKKTIIFQLNENDYEYILQTKTKIIQNISNRKFFTKAALQYSDIINFFEDNPSKRYYIITKGE